MEKILKAIVVKNKKEFAPKSHNIFYLAEMAGIELSDEFENLSGILMKYQIEGRYPEYRPELPTLKKAKEYYERTIQLIKWLKLKL